MRKGMDSKPDFLGSSPQDEFRPELEVESKDGELHLRFFIPTHQEPARPASCLKEAID